MLVLLRALAHLTWSIVIYNARFQWLEYLCFERPAILDVVILPIHPWLNVPWLPATGIIVALVGFI